MKLFYSTYSRNRFSLQIQHLNLEVQPTSINLSELQSRVLGVGLHTNEKKSQKSIRYASCLSGWRCSVRFELSPSSSLKSCLFSSCFVSFFFFKTSVFLSLCSSVVLTIVHYVVDYKVDIKVIINIVLVIVI